MSIKLISIRVVVVAMAFGILAMPTGKLSYAAVEPQASTEQIQKDIHEEAKFMDVLGDDISAGDSFAKAVRHGYELAADDVLIIKVYNEEQLTGQYRIDAVGQVLMPLIGSVDALSKTAQELSVEIERKLKDGYLRRPSVTVEIASFRPFYLLGEVRTPGFYSYAYGLSVIKAVAIAGGYTYRANQKKVYIKRDFNGIKQVMEAHADTLIYPGDVITVKERFF